MLTVRMAGCVFSVSTSRSSGPSKHSWLSGSPSAASASSNTASALRVGLGQRAAHADFLRALPWKHERDHVALTGMAAMPRSSRSTSRPTENRCARPMAFSTAVADERPWPTMTMPLTPSSSAPPYSAASSRRLSSAVSAPLGQRLDHVHQALADLERDVAGEPVAHDHVGHAGIDVARFDVADEVDRRALQQLMRLARQLVALGLLFADRQQPDTRPLESQRNLREHRAHHAELHQMAGPALGVGADVEQDRRALLGRDDRRQRRPFHAGNQAQPGARRHHGRAGAAGRHDRRGVPVGDLLHRDANRRAWLAPQRRRRRLVHPDDVGRIDDRDRQARRDPDTSTARPRSPAPGRPAAPTSAARARPPRRPRRWDRGQSRPPSRRRRLRMWQSSGRLAQGHADGARRVALAARANPRQSRVTLGFVDRLHLPAAIEPAVGAHLVGPLGFLALGAFAELDGRQGVVRPALGGAGL